MPDLDINFQFSANAQSVEAITREARKTTFGFAQAIVEEVALTSSERTYQQLRRRFVRTVRSAIVTEVSRMALAIGTRLPQPEKYGGPRGTLSIKEGMSRTARNFGFRHDFDRGKTNIGKWAKRSKKYLRWKERNGHPRDWWRMRGDLQRDLEAKGGDFYEEAFGPIRVLFTRPVGRDARGRFTKGYGATRTPAVRPDNLKPNADEVNITRAGSGRIGADFTVGRLEVSVFGKITPRLLPALADPKLDPYKAKPAGGGLVDLMPNSEMKMKLATAPKGSPYRYAVEPFVSFYLTRAIPNAIWRRTEALISTQTSDGIGSAGRVG